MINTQVPVITIDGPSGSGKGTISRLLANELGWHFLDSGALYRLVALAARHHTISFDDENALQTLAAHLDVEFVSDDTGQETRTLLEGEEVSNAIRSEESGNDASKVAVIQSVRDALLARQRAFCQPPGLVADGRDMGTVIFPDAKLKVFLDASLEERTSRRHKQLKEKGIDASIDSLFDELAERDRRDRSRAVSPLKPAADAVIIDSSALGIQEVLSQIRLLWQKVEK
ncbi:MAG: (d)CMP kinase [Pseudomonadota bacterium]|nr:(d)CMP kinase [Pseudomonadota bacterium]